MNKLQGVMVSGITAQGFKWLAPVIFCGNRDKVISVVQHKVNHLFLTTKAQKDPYAIDYSLAQTVQGLPVNIRALGISISIPEAAGPSGGIIGNPHLAPRSAEGISENIGSGLSLAALPGGPGLIITGTARQAAKALSGIKPGSGGKQIIKEIHNRITGLDIPLAIAVTDGIATACGAGLLIMENNYWIESL
jgi:hypothetical protein